MANERQSIASVSALLKAGQVEAARLGCNELLTDGPASANVLLMLAQIEIRGGDHVAARLHANAAIALDPTNLHALRLLAMALRGLDRRDEESSVYARILQLSEIDVSSHLNLGRAARLRGEEDIATEHFVAAYKHLCASAEGAAPTRPIRLQTALALQGLYRYDEAVAIHQGLLRESDQEPGCHNALATIARARGDLSTAIVHLEKVVALNVSDPGPQLELAKVLVAAGRLQEAQIIYLRVSGRSSKHFLCRVGLGELADTLEDFDSAAMHFQAALKLDADNASVRVKLGYTLCKMDRWEEAALGFHEILADSPRNVAAITGLARSAEARNDRQAALALMETAKSLAPYDFEIRRTIRRLRVANGPVDWRSEIKDALEVARSTQASLKDRLGAVTSLVQHGLTGAAAPIVAELQERSSQARKLGMAVRQIERMGLAQPWAGGALSADGADDQLESLQGIVEKPIPNAEVMLIVFGQLDHRLWITFSLLHRIVRKAGASVIYVRDTQRNGYAGGIIGLGEDIDSTVEGFRLLATRYGARRILTLGTCLGCIGALRYGLALRAQGVLGLHPRVKADERIMAKKTAQGAPGARQAEPQEPILTAYKDAPNRPKVTLIFGEHCAGDVADARALADVTDVTAIAIPGSSEEATVRDLLVMGVLEPALLDFIATGAISDSTRDRIRSNSSA